MHDIQKLRYTALLMKTFTVLIQYNIIIIYHKISKYNIKM